MSAFELRSAIGTSTEQNTLRAATRWLLERMKYFLSSDIDAVPRVMVSEVCLINTSATVEPHNGSIILSIIERLSSQRQKYCQLVHKKWPLCRAVLCSECPLSEAPPCN